MRHSLTRSLRSTSVAEGPMVICGCTPSLECFGKRLEEVGILPSMGRAGSALDNAISESFVASLTTELLHRHRFISRETARTAVFDYIEGFYNRARRHSSLGCLRPSDYEQATMEEVAVA